MTGAILALNAGSSSLKFALFDLGGGPRLRGSVSGLGTAKTMFETRDAEGQSLVREHWADADPSAAIARLVEWIEDHLGRVPLVGAGHRVVHGGIRFSAPTLIDDAVLEELEALVPLAPLHQPESLLPIRSLAAFRPVLKQVACFDTAFHHRLKPPASRFPLPRDLEQRGLRRFGFHGLSFDYIAHMLAERGDVAPGERVIVAHLGSGSSLCAMIDGESIDTTMGFTALDGVMMGTRPGSLDPGLLLYLIREHGYDADRLEDLLYHRCGLLGVSGLSADVRDLESSDAPAAREALEQFAFSVAGHIAQLAVSLAGLDRIVFTGGIGEHAWGVRAMIAERLAWMGARLDQEANRFSRCRLSAADSRIKIDMVATDEEAIIAGLTTGFCQ